ncbi:MAG: phosphatase PAP2 family protein [Pirellulales bacterium]|nr:phosphatase PAP2 family protein [Pirellulales bacterium]
MTSIREQRQSMNEGRDSRGRAGTFLLVAAAGWLCLAGMAGCTTVETQKNALGDYENWPGHLSDGPPRPSQNPDSWQSTASDGHRTNSESVEHDINSRQAQLTSWSPAEQPFLRRLPPVTNWQLEWERAQRRPQHLADWAASSRMETEPSLADSIEIPLSFTEKLDRTIGPRGEYLLEFGHDVASDYGQFYTLENLGFLAIAFGGAAAIANTPFDNTLHEVLHENLVYTPTDEYAEFIHKNKQFGEGLYVIPAFAALAFVSKGLGETPMAPVVGDWAERSFRGIVVGAPVVVGTQLLTGGSRPSEASYGSRWRPLRDSNGVSGHAFIGAIPFMSAAQMTEDPWLSFGFYTVSLLPALSRITDDAHYPSQALLGWTVAFAATTAVNRSEAENRSTIVRPWSDGDATGFGLESHR